MLNLDHLGYEAADKLDEADIKGYVEWLRDTLIPDLHEATKHEIALDLETCVSLIERGIERAAYRETTTADIERMANAIWPLDKLSSDAAREDLKRDVQRGLNAFFKGDASE